MADIYEEMTPANLDAAFALRELALQNKPGDGSLLFSVASAYGRHSANGMSWFHYEQLTRLQPDNAAALNNAGVAAEGLGFSIRAVRSYRAAEKLGETLASSNLAFELIKRGFLDDAKSVLEKAQENADAHPRVLLALGEIARAEQAEDEKNASIETKATTSQDWRLRHATAILQPALDTTTISGRYTGKPNDLELQMSADGLVSGSFSVSTGFGAPERAELNGRVEGRAITFTWKVIPPTDKGSWYSLLRSGDSGYGLFIANKDELLGYRAKGERSFDLVAGSDFVEWNLTKVTGAEETAR